MLQRKHKSVLSLNLKKLASRFDDLKITLILQNEMLILTLFSKRVLKRREYIPRYRNTINTYFLEIVCTNIFCWNCLFKKILSSYPLDS